MITLTATIILLAGLAFWAGFKARPHPLQYQSQAGFLVFTGLAIFTGYFAWREHRSVAELARFLEPLPGVRETTYIPTPGEFSAVARFLAAVPGETRLGTSQEERRKLSDASSDYHTRYWLLETDLMPDSVAVFYRSTATSSGWTVAYSQDRWLKLERQDTSLLIWSTESFPLPGTDVIVALTTP